MKLYTFDTETGLYLGQDFGTQSDVNIDDGVTDIAPPEYEQGQTPVYDFEQQRWALFSIDKVTSVILQNRLQGLK
ncbi:MAG: hypothetical protein PHD54_13660 [Desulfuromonadaceae bacterium]|nr:hypothetical protein [Desulfuromonadaceae bacterium]